MDKNHATNLEISELFKNAKRASMSERKFLETASDVTLAYINSCNMVSESALDKFRADVIQRELAMRHEWKNSIHWQHYTDNNGFTPYFTGTEIAAHFYAHPYSEHTLRNSANHHYSNFERVDPDNWRNKIGELQALLKSTEDPDEIARLKDNLVALGWNPEVEYNEESVRYAISRVEFKYAQKCYHTSILDCTGFLEMFADRDIDFTPFPSNKLVNIIMCNEQSMDKIIFDRYVNNTDLSDYDGKGNVNVYSFFTYKVDPEMCSQLLHKESGYAVNNFSLPQVIRVSEFLNEFYSAMQAEPIGIDTVKKFIIPMENYQDSITSMNKFLEFCYWRNMSAKPLTMHTAIPEFNNYIQCNRIVPSLL